MSPHHRRPPPVSPLRTAAEVVLEEAEPTAGLSDEELREPGYSRVCTHCLEQLAAALKATTAPERDLMAAEKESEE